jgi:O-antigen ligase
VNRLSLALLVALLVALYFLKGSIGNTLAFVCLFSGAVLTVRERPRISMAALSLLVLVAFRGLVPPYGVDDVSFKAASNAAWLIVLLALVSVAVRDLDPRTILWTFAAVTAAYALAALAGHAIAGSAERLIFPGRAGNPILGSGGIVVGLLAALALWLTERRHTALLVAGVVLGLSAITLGQSRGPMLALGLALSVVAVAWRRPVAGWVIFAAGVAAWLVISGLVVADTAIARELCPHVSLACRAAHRHEVWTEALRLIAEHPWLGVGAEFRFNSASVPHPHNGLLGTAMSYGLPVLAAFLAFLWVAAHAIARLTDPALRLFSIGMFVFALGFMGSDLADPFRFVGLHYVFIWLPLFLALSIDELCTVPKQNSRASPTREDFGQSQSIQPRSLE